MPEKHIVRFQPMVHASYDNESCIEEDHRDPDRFEGGTVLFDPGHVQNGQNDRHMNDEEVKEAEVGERIKQIRRKNRLSSPTHPGKIYDLIQKVAPVE